MRHCEPGPPGVNEGEGAGDSSKLIGRPSLRSWLSSRELIKGFYIIGSQYNVDPKEGETHCVGIWLLWFFLPLRSEV